MSRERREYYTSISFTIPSAPLYSPAAFSKQQKRCKAFSKEKQRYPAVAP